MRRRINGQTMQQRTYAYMRTIQASITATQLAAFEGLEYKTALTRLEDGVAHGWLTKRRLRIGDVRMNFYTVIGKPPEDRRGKHCGESKRRAFYPKWYEQNGVRGRAPRPKPALALTWPSPVAVSLGRRG